MPQPTPHIRLVTDHPEARRVHFGAKVIAALQCPAGKHEVRVFDTKVPGLCCRVRATGAKSFYIYKWALGRPMKYRIGGCNEITIEQAREIAMGWNGDVAKGENPTETRKAERAAKVTLGEMLDAYIDHAEAHLAPRTVKGIRDQKRLYFGPWLAKPLNLISRDEIGAFHSRLGKTKGRTIANRVLATLSAAYNRAPAYIWDGPNPASASKRGIKKFPERGRKRFLSDEELKRFLDAVYDERTNPTIRDFCLIALFTGQRRANVQAMRWDEIDFAGGKWTIPAVKTKTGDVYHVKLAPATLDILEGRRNASEWVFPARHGSSSHLTEPNATFKAVLARAKLSDFRIHDIRHTFASILAKNGTSLPVIGTTLGHKISATTERYAHLSQNAGDVPTVAAVEAMLAARQTRPTTEGNK
jgi:integrase